MREYVMMKINLEKTKVMKINNNHEKMFIMTSERKVLFKSLDIWELY